MYLVSYNDTFFQGDLIMYQLKNIAGGTELTVAYRLADLMIPSRVTVMTARLSWYCEPSDFCRARDFFRAAAWCSSSSSDVSKRREARGESCMTVSRKCAKPRITCSTVFITSLIAGMKLGSAGPVISGFCLY